MQVEGHQEGDVWFEGLEALFVVEGMLDCSDWWHKVRL